MIYVWFMIMGTTAYLISSDKVLKLVAEKDFAFFYRRFNVTFVIPILR